MGAVVVAAAVLPRRSLREHGGAALAVLADTRELAAVAVAAGAVQALVRARGPALAAPALRESSGSTTRSRPYPYLRWPDEES